MLLVLAALIATAGVIGDSTAAVIGAMIVAPLMTPILGTVFAIVIGDRANVLRSLGLVVAGAAAVVVIAWLMGRFIPVEIAAETNSQVAARVHPDRRPARRVKGPLATPRPRFAIRLTPTHRSLPLPDPEKWPSG